MERCNEVVAGWMKAAGLTVHIDATTNLFGRLPGVDPGKRLFLMGSHLDTVRNAGAFDGVLGVILALALVENLNRPLPFDLEVIAFAGEEGVASPPFTGSRAFVGTPSPAFGYLEVHIEQGPVLDHANEPIAVVEAIAGQTRALVTFKGSSNHAGTTPMSLRNDALVAASRWISTVDEIARATPDLVATVGQLDVRPNISNVIPGQVIASLDLRHPDDLIRQQAFDRCRNATAIWSNPVSVNTVPLDAALTCKLEAACPQGTRRMISGAGHDAMILAPHIPSAMLFLRSPGGISHHPDESVLPEDIDLALAIGQRFLESL